MENVKKPVILCVIHHRQNPIKSTQSCSVYKFLQYSEISMCRNKYDIHTDAQYIHTDFKAVAVASPLTILWHDAWKSEKAVSDNGSVNTHSRGNGYADWNRQTIQGSVLFAARAGLYKKET
jgi:hypothetical protein